MQLISRLVLGLLVCTAAACNAAEQNPIDIMIDAAGVARENAPVTAEIDRQHLPDLRGDVEATLHADGKDPIPAQVEQRGDKVILRWIEPQLGADETRTYTARFAPRSKSRASFRFVGGRGFRDLVHGETPILRHMNVFDPKNHEQTHKPFHHVFRFDSPDGFITNGPGGKYPHHRGLFFGFNKTPYGDFWHCRDVSQQHRRYLANEEFTGPVAARGVGVAEWVDAQGNAVVRDMRRVTTWRVSPTYLVLDFEITLDTLTGQTFALNGDAHHSGFHFRAANELAEREAAGEARAHYTYSPAAEHVGNDIWKGTDFVHATFTIAGKDYAVTHLNHPSNPQPTTYSTRPYGRFGAFFTYDLQPNQPLTIRYRVIIRDGAASDASQEALARTLADFATPPRVTVAP